MKTFASINIKITKHLENFLYNIVCKQIDRENPEESRKSQSPPNMSFLTSWQVYAKVLIASVSSPSTTVLFPGSSIHVDKSSE